MVRSSSTRDDTRTPTRTPAAPHLLVGQRLALPEVVVAHVVAVVRCEDYVCAVKHTLGRQLLDCAGVGGGELQLPSDCESKRAQSFPSSP